MPGSMDVSVIIVTWNSREQIKKCLQHLFRQTILPSYVIVIDNDSQDDSANTAEEFEGVVVRRMDSNLGFAAGNNLAINECKTEWLALLNPDAFPEPDWLENLLAAATENPDAKVFGSRQLCHHDPGKIDGLGDVYHISGNVWRDAHGASLQESDLVSGEIFSPCAAAALYQRQAVIEVGGFDEDYFCYLEDVDLGFRLRLGGYTALYVPAAVVHHVGSVSTGGQHSDFSVYHGHRNLVWTFIKNMPGILFWLFLPLHLLLNVITIFWFVARGQGRVILRSKRDAIRGIPRMWVKRKLIGSKRRVGIAEIWTILDKSLPGTRR